MDGTCPMYRDLPAVAIHLIQEMVCSRILRIGFYSSPTDPAHEDEQLEMWIEECNCMGVLIFARKLWVRTISMAVRFVSLTATIRVASVSKQWFQTAIFVFQRERFLVVDAHRLRHTPRTAFGNWISQCTLQYSLHTSLVCALRLHRFNAPNLVSPNNENSCGDE